MRLMYSLTRYSVLGWIAVFGLLAGCTANEFRTAFSIPGVINNQNTTIEQVASKDNLQKLASILRYEQFIHGLQVEDLELERDLLETSIDTATDAALIKLALLYSHKNSSFYDTVRAQSILQSCLDDNGETPTEVTAFTSLIAELLIEMIDQQKRLKTMQNELSTERAQRKILKEQLDALKAIEESIKDRSRHLSESIR